MVSHAGKTALLWLFVAMTMASCSDTRGIALADVPYKQWPSHTAVRAAIVNPDTLTPRDLYLVVRHNATLNQNKIRLMIETTSPDGKYVVEIVSISLTTPNKHNGGFVESEIPYRTQSVLGCMGEYRFAISHLSEPLDGIQSIGIVVKK